MEDEGAGEREESRTALDARPEDELHPSAGSFEGRKPKNQNQKNKKGEFDNEQNKIRVFCKNES